MLTGFQHLHSTLAVVLLLGLIVSIGVTFANFSGNKPYNRKIALLGLITSHLQLIVGLVYFFALLHHSKIVSVLIYTLAFRIIVFKPPLMMLLPVIFITVRYQRIKCMTHAKQANKTVLIFYIFGLIFVLSRLPWSTWTLINLLG